MPTNPGYYQYEDGQLIPRPYEGQSLYSYLESRNYDTGAQLDKVGHSFYYYRKLKLSTYL